VFVLNADSAASANTFLLMKNAVKIISKKFGVARFQYAIIVYGTTVTKAFDFSDSLPYQAALAKKVDALVRLGGVSKLSDALDQVQVIFKSPKARPNARKAVVIIQDKKTGSTVSQLQSLARPLFDEGMIVVGVGIGNEVTLNDERALTIRKQDAFKVPTNEPTGSLGDKIVVRILKGKYTQ